jgi:hypothetical protein
MASDTIAAGSPVDAGGESSFPSFSPSHPPELPVAVSAGSADAAPSEADVTFAEPAEAPASKHRRRKPVSPRQRAANRRNAASSTGPRTDIGKQVAAMNARRHGVYGHAAILPGEDEEAYNAIVEELIKQYQPAGPIEEILLGRLAAIDWKLRRLAQAEADIGWRNINRRARNHQAEMETAAFFGKDISRMAFEAPDDESMAQEIYADDFQESGEPGRLQQITNLEIRLTGQMLAISRQLLQLRKQRMKEEEAGLETEAAFDETVRPVAAERATPKRNEPIRNQPAAHRRKAASPVDGRRARHKARQADRQVADASVCEGLPRLGVPSRGTRKGSSKRTDATPARNEPIRNARGTQPTAKHAEKPTPRAERRAPKRGGARKVVRKGRKQRRKVKTSTSASPTRVENPCYGKAARPRCSTGFQPVSAMRHSEQRKTPPPNKRRKRTSKRARRGTKR